LVKGKKGGSARSTARSGQLDDGGSAGGWVDGCRLGRDPEGSEQPLGAGGAPLFDRPAALERGLELGSLH